MIEAELAQPFGTTVLGVPVKLTKIEQADDDGIVEVCRRGIETQRIGVLDLPLPGPTPAGVQHQVPITGNPGVERRRTLGLSCQAPWGGGCRLAGRPSSRVSSSRGRAQASVLAAGHATTAVRWHRAQSRGPSHGDVVCVDKVVPCRESIRVNRDHGRCSGWRSKSLPG
jgi:hypothetical protein